MQILPQSGRVAVAESIALRPIHFAWGLGDGSWIEPPAPSNNATALMVEVGRRTANAAQYVVPDEDGDIEAPDGSKWSLSPSGAPTKHIMLSVTFEFGEEPGSVIREYGVFVGTETDPLLPPGQRYFTPAQVTSPGRLLYLGNIEPIFRSPAIRESFRVVITF